MFQEFALKKIVFMACAFAATHSASWAQGLYQSTFAPTQAVVQSAPWSSAQALKSALRRQPALFTSGNLSDIERARLNARVLELARQVERAWIEAVAARQSESHVREAHQAAQVASALAQRMNEAGNWSKVPLLQAQLLESEAAVQVARAQQQTLSARERLLRLLNLDDDAAAPFNLPARLPDLPTAPLPASETKASPPELQLARSNAELARSATTPAELVQWQQTIDAALEATPLTLTTPAPQLDPRRLLNRPALSHALQAQAQLDAASANARSQQREAYARYRSAYDVARHQRDDTVRLNTALQEETQLRYNGMLQSTWDLLASARARVQSQSASVQAQRDFWLAHTDLQTVLAGADVTFSNDTGTSNARASTSQGH